MITIKQKIEDKISRAWKRHVFARKDFINLGEYDQVGRALLTLTKEGRLIRIGYGLYAKARPNRITGLPMFSAPGGFDQVAKEALSLLKVQWKPSDSEQAYNNGSTQIPANASICILGRFNRVIGTEKFKLQVQRH